MPRGAIGSRSALCSARAEIDPVTAIAVIGNLTRDVVADGPPRPGGAVFYAARALARLGADACVGVSCARDDWAVLAPHVEGFPLPVTWYESPTTTAYSFHYDGDRRIMQQVAVGEPWPADRAVEAVGDASWVHVGALVRTDFPAPTLTALARDDRRLLVDAQGLVRTAELGSLRTDGDVGDVLRHVHILKLNDEEAKTLVGSSEPDALLTLGVQEVLLTLGSQGSWVVAGGEIVRVPARRIAGPVDPTGAGDTFSAAYLTARAAGHDPVAAGEEASAAVADFLAG
jgi:sugar/nucleoside kinase (ribokinase family)